MDKPPVVPTNAELNEEIQKLQSTVNKLVYDVECLKAQNEQLKRQLSNRY